MAPLRHARMERLLGERIEPERWRRSSSGSGSSRRTARPPTATVLARAPLARRRRAARGRPDRGGRPHPRLDKLPTTLPARQSAVGRLTPSQRLRAGASRTLLRDRGLHECVAYSFTSPARAERLRLGDVPVLRLDNPLSEEQSVMRPLLLPGLLDAARHNAAHGRPGGGAVRVRARLSARAPLDRRPTDRPRARTPAPRAPPPRGAPDRGQARGWRTPAQPADFYRRARAARGAARGGADVGGGGRPSRAASVPASGPAGAGDRPRRPKARLARRAPPARVAAWDLPGPVAAFELDLDAVTELTAGRSPRTAT